MKNKLVNKSRIYLVSAIVILIFIFWIILSSVVLSSGAFYDGIYIEGISLKGLNKPEANKLISSKVNEIYGKDGFTLKYKENSWHINFADIAFTFLPDMAIEEAYKIGRSGNYPKRLYDIFRLRFNNVNLNTDAYFDKSKLRDKLYSIKASLDSVSRDASVSYENGKVKIEKDIAGITMDIDRNMKLAENSLRERRPEMQLYIEESRPLILYEKIRDVNSVLSSFSTAFNVNDINRSHNIRYACEKINGIILFPGDIFSMDAALGPRTIENGYREAPVIFKNELVSGPGGGVCQVTTTLYVSVLKSKLKVLERTHHSMPLGYVELGQDATIAGNLIDLKFQNNRDYPVCISAGVSGNEITITVLGKNDGNSHDVRLKSVVAEVFTTSEEDVIIDDSIPDNEKILVHGPKNGYRVILYRQTFDANGNLTDNEMISEDIYQPVKAKVKVNSNYKKAAMSLID